MREKDVSHWHILGAGSIGCLWASKMLQSGFHCTMLLRPEKLSQFTESSHSLIFTENGKTSSKEVELEPAGSASTIHNLLVTTKAVDALSAVQSVSGQLSSHATIVLLQNGMGSQQDIAKSFPDHSIYAGSTTDGAWLAGFLNVQRAGRGKTLLGPLTSKLSQTVQQLLEIQDMDIALVGDVKSRLLEKLAINSAINGLAALHNCQNGDLLQPKHYPELIQLCQETEAVLAAHGYSLEKSLLDTVTHVLTITKTNICSTVQDARNSRPTELPWINGYLIDLANQLGINVPTHKKLMNALNEQGIY